MQESRLFKIVYHLLDKGRATASELAEKFEVSVPNSKRNYRVPSFFGIIFYFASNQHALCAWIAKSKNILAEQFD